MHLFSLLLRLYPSSFRNEYGDEMRRLFAERRRRAGTALRVALWIEAVRDAFTTAPRVHLDILAQDLRYTRRALARTPSFAAAAILVMALGIGATTNESASSRVSPGSSSRFRRPSTSIGS